MSNLGDGLNSPAIEQDPSVAQLQAAAAGIGAAIAVNLPETGFVGSLNALTGLVNLQSGSSSTGVTVVVSSDGVSNISIGVQGITAPAVAKSNIAAAAPTPSDDESLGYSEFSLWIDSSVPDVYMCLDPATLTAVWVKLN